MAFDKLLQWDGVRSRGQLPLIPQAPLVVRLVDVATSQAKSLLHSAVDLPWDVVVPDVCAPPDPVPPYVDAVDSHHDVRVLAPL